MPITNFIQSSGHAGKGETVDSRRRLREAGEDDSSDNVVGSGIGMQAQVKTVRGELNNWINNDIEETWEDWCLADTCHTGGVLKLADIERLAMGQVFDIQRNLPVRKYSRAFGPSKIPHAPEVIEPERIVDEFQPSSPFPNAVVRMGIDNDEFLEGRSPIQSENSTLANIDILWGRRTPTKGSPPTKLST